MLRTDAILSGGAFGGLKRKMGNSLRLASLFMDGVVLQRDLPVPVWGEGPEGARVVLEIAGQTADTVVENGQWRANLEPLQAGAGLELTVASNSEKKVIRNVAVGEVWIAGGQSNMEFALKFDAEGPEMIAGADDPEIRFFDVPKISYEGQEKDEDFSTAGFWRTFDPLSAPYFTAVGTYFAIRLRKTLGVPIGIIGCNWGDLRIGMDVRTILE